jgi:hypothetical protein
MLAYIVDRHLDAAPEKPDRLLIYVDQWEELYAMAPPPEDTAHLKQHSSDVEKFVALLVEAASGAGPRASVVLTVRADFYNPLIRNPLLAALLPKQQVNIPPMNRDDLRWAIETPAKQAGLSFAPPQLVDQILDDVGLEEGRLPLLQFALKETWEKRAGAQLAAEAYTAVGGVARAIEKTAEDAYGRLTPAQQDAARRLFLRLVTPGEGQADTRARSAIPDDPQQRDIVAIFSNPIHRGVQLERGRALLENPGDVPVDDILGYVGRSIEGEDNRRAAERAKEDAQRQKELADQKLIADAETKLRTTAEEKARVEEIARKNPEASARKLRTRLLVAGGAAAVAVAFLIVSRYEYHRAQSELDRANQALAQPINNDLGLQPNTYFTARQRRALWKLAVADESVKRNFVLLLSESPEETARASPGFAEITRAMGLLRPTPAEASGLYSASIKALKMSNKNAGSLVDEIKALGSELHNGDYPEDRQIIPSAEVEEAMAANLPPDRAERVKSAFLTINRLKEDHSREVLKAASMVSPRDASDMFQAVSPQPQEVSKNEFLNSFLEHMSSTTDPEALQAFAQALPGLAPMLSEPLLEEAIDSLLLQIGKTGDPEALRTLAQAISPLALRISQTRKQFSLDPLWLTLDQSSDPYRIEALALAIQALPAKLAATRAQEARERIQRQMLQRTDPDSLQALTQALQALSAKIDEARANEELEPVLGQIGLTASAESLDSVLRQIGQESSPYKLQTLVQTLSRLSSSLTEEQVENAWEPVSEQIRVTSDPFALRALSQAVSTLAPRLSENQSQRALDIAKRSLAWAASADDAAGWARALVALSSRIPDQTRRTLLVVAALAYPAAAGSATEILLDAIRTQNRDAPRKEAGTESTLKWLATKYPWLVDPPFCPDPPQSFETSGLQCP